MTKKKLHKVWTKQLINILSKTISFDVNCLASKSRVT